MFVSPKQLGLKPWLVCLITLGGVLGCQPAEEENLPTGPPRLIDDKYSQLLKTSVGPTSEVRPGACHLESLGVSRRRIKVEFRCGAEKKRVYLTLVPTPGPEKALTQTKRFAILSSGTTPPPEGLVADLAIRLKAGDRFDWEKIGTEPDAPSLEYLPLRTRSEAVNKKYFEALELYRKHKHDEALEIYMEMSKTHPYNGGLGMVVATLAGGGVSAARLEELEKDAKEDPKDALKQFMAGVGTHYRAHDGAGSVEEKRQLYGRAITYLDRVAETYDFEPRVFIYLAVSHFRLGHQEKAEELIQRAIELGVDDPDAYYCRAEIFQRTNIERSLKDLDIYLGTMKKNMEGGAVASPTKLNRVYEMRQHLRDVASGRVEPEEIFDPMDAAQLPLGISHDFVLAVEDFAPWVGGFLGLIFAGFWAYRRRSKEDFSAPT